MPVENSNDNYSSTGRIVPFAMRRFVRAREVLGARLKQLRARRELLGFDRLHLGCGPRQLAGWANIDIEGSQNIICDLRLPLPVRPRSIAFIYSEHFLEHIHRDEALRLLTNCRALLVPGGVIRISTPNLRRLTGDYTARRFPILPKELWDPQTLCRMVNEGMRSWGHMFIYDEEELIDLFREAGYVESRRMNWGESNHPELRNLESRPDNDDLIVEATIL